MQHFFNLRTQKIFYLQQGQTYNHKSQLVKLAIHENNIEMLMRYLHQKLIGKGHNMT